MNKSNSAREEIEKEVNKLLNSFEYAGRRVIALPLTTKEIKERMLILLLTKVAKARREALEELARNFDKLGETKLDKWTASDVSRVIRNELNQKGE